MLKTKKSDINGEVILFISFFLVFKFKKFEIVFIESVH